MREHYTIGLAELEAIVKSLQSPTKRNQPGTTESCFSKALADGFASISDIEDIFYISDVRLDTLCHALPVERWCEILSIPVRYYYQRPRRKQSSVTGFHGVSVDGLADLLLNIESIGYSVDPLSLVAKVAFSLVDRAFVNDAELNALWYSKTRHKTRISFKVGPDEMGQGWREEKFRTALGYKGEVIWNTGDKPIQLTVRGPKYRSRPAPVLTKCEVCGGEWYRGDSDSSAAHRREHARRLRYLDPKPDPRFSEEDQHGYGLFRVTTNSPRWAHNQIYLRALAFKREFRYDFVQWGSPKGDTDSNVRGYLFINPEKIAVGACAFRWRKDEGKSFWGLQWVWIAPKYRRSGVLSQNWTVLRQLHGDFYVEPPVSDAMVAFVTKEGDRDLLEVATLSSQGSSPPL